MLIKKLTVIYGDREILSWRKKRKEVAETRREIEFIFHLLDLDQSKH